MQLGVQNRFPTDGTFLFRIHIPLASKKRCKSHLKKSKWSLAHLLMTQIISLQDTAKRAFFILRTRSFAIP